MVVLLDGLRTPSFEGLKLGWDAMLITVFETTVYCTFILSLMISEIRIVATKSRFMKACYTL